MNDASLVRLGLLSRVHGLKGQIVARPESVGSDVLLGVSSLVLRRSGVPDRRLDVRDARLHSGVMLLAFAGFPDRTAVELLVGCELWADAAQLPPPREDEFYAAELIGLPVDTPAGRVGTVVDLETAPPLAWLVVQTAQGRSLVPLTEPLTRVEREAGRVWVDAPEGLFDADLGG